MFIVYAMLSVFVLLTLLLGVINGVNFTMAAADADRITQMIGEQGGSLRHGPFDRQFAGNTGETPADAPQQQSGGFENGRGRFDMQGPNSPELTKTVRYFTVVFDSAGGTLAAYEISAVDQAEAVRWAQSLLSQQETGWTRSTYRYRVYELNGNTAVTVIDQGRELTPSHRILMISVIGEAMGLAVSCLVLLFVAKKLYQPLEEADRKQKRFISEAESAFKVPLTVINADTEILERENGASEQLNSINRQVKKMTALVKELGSLAIYGEDAGIPANIDLSDLLSALLDASSDRFAAAGIGLSAEIAPGVMLTADDAAMRKLLSELIENTLKFGKNNAAISLEQKEGHVTLTFSNGTDLPDGAAQQAFDRFTRLPNAEGVPGAGLGLAFVKDVVRAMDGRAEAAVKDGVFTLRIRF